MRILVTGGAGFIGTNLIKRLVSEGHEVWSIDNYDSGTKDNHVERAIYHTQDIERENFWNGNILSWLTQMEFDICFHLAALSRIQPSFQDPLRTYKVNTEATGYIAEWARKNNVKVVYAGSSSRWHDPYQSPYACYKHMGEEILKLYKKVYGCKFETARFYNVYGPGEIVDGDWAAVTGIWRRQVRDGKKITIVGDGEQRRDFTHVSDIVDGLYRIAMSDEQHEDAWELGTGVNFSINELYAMFKEQFGVECEYVPEQAGNYRKTLQENKDANERLGWSPTDQLQQYIIIHNIT
jgi:UDP-glucose 4-epimerase